MNIQKITENLEKLPQMIRDSANLKVEAKQKTEIAKLRYEVTISQGMLKSTKANATLQKAESIIYAKEEKKALFEAELYESKLDNEVEYLKNNFISTRKLANLHELEANNTSRQGF